MWRASEEPEDAENVEMNCRQGQQRAPRQRCISALGKQLQAGTPSAVSNAREGSL